MFQENSSEFLSFGETTIEKSAVIDLLVKFM